MTNADRITRRRQAEALDREATKLYDKLNPDWEREIKVSKAECIRRVEQRKRFR